jgi:tripartite-type tricarboxylate transporter receptor subunit TctC
MKTARPVLISSAMSVMLMVSAMSAAQPNVAAGYPSRPIRVVTSSPPGSPPDVLARVVAEPLAAALGRPVVVDNRPGGSGTIGLSVVARAAPDGYTLGIMTLQNIVAPSLVAQMPYDTARDLAPVTQLAWTANILIVRASSPLKSVADYIALAKTKPGRLSYASAGNGTPSHLTSELFRRHAGIEVHHIPYKGIASGITAVLGEQVDIAFAGVATAAPLVKSGKLRALGTAAPRRLPAFPDLPTISELGFPGFHVDEWQGVVVPSGTPVAVTAKLAQELARIIKLPEVNERLEPIGLNAAGKLGTEAFAVLLRSELPRWTKLVRDAGIRAD